LRARAADSGVEFAMPRGIATWRRASQLSVALLERLPSTLFMDNWLGM